MKFNKSIFEKLQEIGSVQNRILMDIDERFVCWNFLIKSLILFIVKIFIFS
jgi:hypothetical protein